MVQVTLYNYSRAGVPMEILSRYPEIEKSPGLQKAINNIRLSLYRNNVDYYNDLNIFYSVDTVNRRVSMVALANYKPNHDYEEKTSIYECDFWTMEYFNF